MGIVTEILLQQEEERMQKLQTEIQYLKDKNAKLSAAAKEAMSSLEESLSMIDFYENGNFAEKAEDAIQNLRELL